MGRKWCLAFWFILSTLQAAPRYPDDFRLLTFNVFMIPRLITHWGQESRAELIASAEFMQGQDLIILNELFDDNATQILLNGKKAEYPYQTDVLADPKGHWDTTLGTWNPLRPGNGGVAIISRWPILEKIQSLYKHSCGSDFFSKKGFVYVKVLKNGQPYHVIGTHVQSDAQGCESAAATRATQFDEIRQFLQWKNIPTGEVVFIGGDLNVMKGTAEYYDLLQRLQVKEPDSYAGHFSSWDPIGNAIAAGQYPDANHSEYLDYIFVSSHHAQPSHWHNQALDIPSPRWAEGYSYYQEYSDHYPVTAFAYADEHTPKQSFRADNRPYDTVHLKHEASGRYISVNDPVPNAWLTVSASSTEPHTAFHLDNWYPAKHPFCIRSGDFVQLQSLAHPGYYWNWHWGIKNNYGYYLKPSDSSNMLRLKIVDDHGTCLKHGDRVYFVDRNSLSGQDHTLQIWQDHMFLGSADVSAQDIFTLEMPSVPVFADWTPGLKYQDE